MFTGCDASHRVMLDGFACLPEQFVGCVFFVGVEVDDFGEVGGCLGGVGLVVGFVVPAEELAFGGGGEVEVGGYGGEGLGLLVLRGLVGGVGRCVALGEAGVFGGEVWGGCDCWLVGVVDYGLVCSVGY